MPGEKPKFGSECVRFGGRGSKAGNSAALRTPNNPLGTGIDRGDPGQRLKWSHRSPSLPPLTLMKIVNFFRGSALG